jgi:organic hydroperoxide reductase OsmC/OhrA
MLSADPAFLGQPQKLNPEQLLLVSVSSCQLLSFLAIAARARVQVLDYEDHAEAQMPEEDKPMRLTKLTLRPRIVVGPGVKEERVLKLTEMAHKQCYISNSLSIEIVVEPTVEIRE